MKHISKLTIATAMMLTVSALSTADTIRIRRNEVINIVMGDSLSASHTRSGDKFMAWIDERGFPSGTKLFGRVNRVDRRRDHAAIDLEFQTIRFPDGTRKSIDAVPVSLSRGRYERNRDGRLEARKPKNSDATVAGGLLAGFILGKIIGKPAEGAFWGTVAGILVSGIEQSEGGAFFRKGDRMGAMFEKDFNVNVRMDRDDRYGRNDPWNEDRASRRDEDFDQNDDQKRDPEDDRNREKDRDQFESRRDECEIRYRGKSIEFNRDEMPFYSGSVLMVPLSQMAERLGLSVDVREQNQRIYVEDDENSAILELSSKQYRLNGRKKQLNGNIETRNEVLYVPIQLFEEMRKNEIEVQKNSRR